MVLPRIDLFVTAKCNNRCPVCYVPFHWPEQLDIRDPTIEELKEIIDKLVGIGLEKLNFTGGEPLVRDDIVDIIQYTHKKGVKVYLSTNDHHLLEKYEQLAPYLTWLSLSLEGVDTQIVRKIKGDAHQIDVITKILDYFDENSPNHGVSIGTIVTKQNVGYLEPIGDLLTSRQYVPNQWKLYQYCSRGPRQTSKTRQQNELNENNFCSTTQDILTRYGKQVNINIYPISKRSSRNILILPDLIIAVAVDDDYKYYGSILHKSSSCLSNLISQLQDEGILDQNAYDNWPGQCK